MISVKYLFVIVIVLYLSTHSYASGGCEELCEEEGVIWGSNRIGEKTCDNFPAQLIHSEIDYSQLTWETIRRDTTSRWMLGGLIVANNGDWLIGS